MKDITQHFDLTTSQGSPIPGHRQVRNRAGGYVFEADDWTRLRRFLVLGSQANYYASAREVTRENATVIDRLLEQGEGIRLVDEVVSVSLAGRAPRSEPGIFALALALKTAPDIRTRRAASAAVSQVCRIGTHLTSWATAVEALGVPSGKEPRKGTGGGWGPLTRAAIAHWVADRSAEDVLFQAVKYGRRQQWRFTDLLRLAHPPAPTPLHAKVFNYLLERQAGEKSPRRGYRTDLTHNIPFVEGYEAIQDPGISAQEAAEYVVQYHLPWEVVPSQWAKNHEVQEALLERMPVAATVRQLGRLGAIELLVPGSYASQVVTERLMDAQRVASSRIHPMAIYLALRQYRLGHGDEGKLTWSPVAAVSHALEAAFFNAFRGRPRSTRPITVAIDCSGSMWNFTVADSDHLKAAEAAAVMAYVQTTGNPNARLIAFTDHIKGEARLPEGGSLADVERALRAWSIPERTDCAQPLLWAAREHRDTTAVVTHSDEETWAGHTHPIEALTGLRRSVERPVKMVCAAYTATSSRLAGYGDDAGLLEVTGLDSAMPQIVDDFVDSDLA